MSVRETKITWKYIKRRCKRYLRKLLLKIKKWKERREVSPEIDNQNSYTPQHGEIIHLSKDEKDGIRIQFEKEENETTYNFSSIQEMTDFFQMKSREESVRFLKEHENIKEYDQYLVSLIWENIMNGTASDLGLTKRILDIWEETDDRGAIEMFFKIFTGMDFLKYITLCGDAVQKNGQ